MKNTPIPIIRAAEVRARGGSWPAAAKAIDWTADELQAWTREHPRAWACEMGRARHAVRGEACDEAVAMLRTRLRDEEARNILTAAGTLTARFANPKRQSRKPAPRAKDAPAQFLDLLNSIPEGRPTRVDQHLQAAEDESRESAKARGTRAG